MAGDAGEAEPVIVAVAAEEALWCEVTTVAMPALAPATANTLAAASTGAQPAPDGAQAAPRARLPVSAASLPGLAGQPERDIFYGYPARRLGGDPVQHLR